MARHKRSTQANLPAMSYAYTGPPAGTSVVTSPGQPSYTWSTGDLLFGTVGTAAGTKAASVSQSALRPPKHDDVHDGVMLALYPSPQDAAAMALPGGTDPAELHVTVAYLGKAAEVDAAALQDAAQRIAAAVPPIGGVFAGHGRFTGGDDGDVLVALFDSPLLERARRITCEALDYHGLELVRTHGYTPHMTLGYLDAQAVAPIRRLEPRPVTFTALAVVHGAERIDLPLRATAPFQPAVDTKSAADLGDFVLIDGVLGRVDLIVAGGQLPAAISADGQPVIGTKDHPAARVVTYVPAGDGTFTATGERIACPAGRLRRIAPLRTRQSKSLAEALGWAQIGFADPARQGPPLDLLKTVHTRGVKSWPGPGATTLTAEQWGLGRVDAFTAAWHGLRPAGYHGDDDLLLSEGTTR